MTLPSIPDELKLPMREGYLYEYGEGRRFVDEDAGAPRVGPQFSQVADPVSMVLDVSRAELGIFETFYKESLKRGVLPFTMPDPTTDRWPALMPDGTPILDGEGNPTLMARTWTVMFGKGGLPRVSVYGVRFRVSFQLWVMP